MKKIEKLEAQVITYFNSHDIEVTDMFNLDEFAEETNLEVDEATTLLCNLDDPNLMTEIAWGDYSNFDMYESRYFNDGYEEMMEDLGYDDPE